MKYSVIVPAYNCEKSIENTVQSIISSGLSDYQIIIVDDGSIDDTAAICDKLAAEDNQITCIHQKNAGVSSARNRGLLTAKGEYILFWDADDTVDQGALTSATEVIDREQPDMLIFGMSFDYIHKGRVYRRDEMIYPYEGMWRADQIASRFDELYECNALTPVWNKIYKRQLLIDTGCLFRTDYFLMEDFLFVLESLKGCKTVYTLPKAIYRYKQAEDEMNACRRLKRVSSLTKFMEPFLGAVHRLGYGERAIHDIYYMLMQQKMYYASSAEIECIGNDFLQGMFSLRRDCIPEKDQYFVECVTKKRWKYLRFCNLKSQARHKVANFLKKVGVIPIR